MFSILRAKEAPGLFTQLSGWFEQEWGAIDALFGPTIPDPILIVSESGALAGGLAFTRTAVPSTLPEQAKLGLWVNVLYISPEFRRQGLASQLIAAAEKQAWHSSDDSILYVYSNAPQVYLNNDWVLVSQDGPDCVLSTSKT